MLMLSVSVTPAAIGSQDAEFSQPRAKKIYPFDYSVISCISIEVPEALERGAQQSDDHERYPDPLGPLRPARVGRRPRMLHAHLRGRNRGAQGDNEKDHNKFDPRSIYSIDRLSTNKKSMINI